MKRRIFGPGVYELDLERSSVFGAPSSNFQSYNSSSFSTADSIWKGAQFFPSDDHNSRGNFSPRLHGL